MRSHTIVVALLSSQLLNASGLVDGAELDGADNESQSILDQTSTVPRVAIEHARSGNYAAALPYYRSAVQNDPNNADLHESLGLILIAAGHIDEAVDECREATRLNPAQASYHFSLALGLRQQGNIDESIDEFSEAIRLDPQDHQAHNELGITYQYLKQYTNAIESFSTSLSKKESTTTRLHRSAAYFDSGQYLAAIKDCDIVLNADPRSCGAYAYRAYANLRSGKLDEAESDSRQAIEIGNDYADMAYMVLGGVSLMRRNENEAIKHLTKAIELEPKHTTPYIFRALAQVGHLRWDSAVTDLTAAIETRDGPEDLNYVLNGYGWQVYKFRGIAKLLFLRSTDEAICDLTQAIALNDRDSDCYAMRGWAHLSSGNAKLALADLEEALQVEPNHGLASYLLVKLFTRFPDEDIRDGHRAMNVAIRACDHTKWKSPAHVQGLAAAYAEIGDFPTACKLQSKAIELSRQHTYRREMTIWWNTKMALSLSVNEADAAELLHRYEKGLQASPETGTAEHVSTAVK